MKITTTLVKELVETQFPQWSHFPITPIAPSGWDNRTFRLGEGMSVRLPSAEGYASQVVKEQEWLPKLAPHLSFPIPKPLAMGLPSKSYPWNWSIYQWIEGENVNAFHELDLKQLAKQFAQFLIELQKIDASAGPVSGSHNYYRGGDLSIYDMESRIAINQVKGLVDVDAVTEIWEKALSTKWSNEPVWVHGDFEVDNILFQKGRLSAVIDFGCVGVGDPACDLAIAWTFLTEESRDIFRSSLELDSDTWARARGWVIWKSLIMLIQSNDNKNVNPSQRLEIIKEVISDHEFEKKR